MRRNLFFLFGWFAIGTLCLAMSGLPWGFYGHRKITELAVYTLPPPLILFYKEHSSSLIEQSVAADKRRYVIVEEGPRHYIDLDLYDFGDSLPKYWQVALDRYGEDSLNARGIVPWYSQFTFKRLTRAMADHDISGILRYSSDLSHYIADANVPLHTTSNYNGQLTNQVGIHAFWESRLPELYAQDYDFFVGQAEYIPDTQKVLWEAIFEANAMVDSLLSLDLTLTDILGEDKKYAFEQRGKSTVRVASRQFSKKYHDAFPMVEKQMRNAIKMVGDFWYTAWIDAGQPDLTDFETIYSSSKKEERAPGAESEITPDRVHKH